MGENEASSKLIKGTMVYMLGNVLSKLLQFVMLPIVTAVLVTSEYGYYDLVITTVSLVMPIITMQLIEAVFRFMFNSDEGEKKRIISTVSIFLILGILILAIIILIMYKITDFIIYPLLVIGYYSTYIVFTFYQKICRSIQKNTVFAISGVLNTFILLSVEIICLLVLNLRVDGLLLAQVISNVVCIFYLEKETKVIKMFSFNSVNIETFKSMVKFSLPLVPNSISWWFVSSINKYVITIFLDVGINGIYSIANKFPQMLTFVTSVFQMSWQESAIMEYNSEERDRFYSNVFNSYMKFLLGGTIIVLPVIKIIFPIMISKSYYEGILYVPILLLGVIFSAFSQFYGTAYLVFKKTGGAFSTTIVAAVINLICTISLISDFGLFAPAIGTMMAYLIQWIYRIYQMRSYFKIKLNKPVIIQYVLLIVLYLYLYYEVSVIYVQVFAAIVAFCIFLFTNKDLVKGLLSKVLKKSYIRK